MKSVTLMEILQAREDRVRRQEALLAQYQKPLICFTMNIAGPVKTDPQIERGFREGCRALDQQLLRCRLPVLHRELLVADTGCGIPDEIKNKIFEPFFTTKEAGKGTGLGLAIAAQVLEDHHGTIAVNSTPGQGTIMTINLPKAAEQQNID